SRIAWRVPAPRSRSLQCRLPEPTSYDTLSPAIRKQARLPQIARIEKSHGCEPTKFHGASRKAVVATAGWPDHGTVPHSESVQSVLLLARPAAPRAKCPAMNDQPATITRELLRRDSNGVAYMTLNRPAARNALTLSLMAALDAELGAIATDHSVKVVVIAGAGPA